MTIKFSTYDEGSKYVAMREKQIGKMKYRSTQEYREIYPVLVKMYQDAGYKAPKKRRVEVSICLHV